MGKGKKEKTMDFRKTAQEATTLSELMNGATKISTEEVIANFPNGITITAVDKIQTGNDSYAVFRFAEDKTKFYCGGTVLTKIADAWLANFDGNSASCSDALAGAGGVKVKLSLGRTKDNKHVTNVEVL